VANQRKRAEALSRHKVVEERLTDEIKGVTLWNESVIGK